MIRNYLLIAFRNFFKYKTYTLINILGVAIGTAAFLLILHYVSFERSYDKFHENSDRIYRLRYERASESGETVRFASCCPPAALRIRGQFPEVENIARIYRYPAIISHENNKFSEEMLFYGEPQIIDVLNFDFISIEDTDALAKPNNAYISVSTANKYFGTTNCIGKTLSFNGKTDFRISGIYKDIPSNSHIKIDFLLSYQNLLSIFGQEMEDAWGHTGFFTYLRIREGVNIPELQKKFEQIGIDEWGEVLDYYKLKMYLPMQPIEDIHLISHYQQEFVVNGNDGTVNILFIIAFFIIVIAWINYINLSTAQSLKRAKEIGLRKVIGASRSQLAVQLFIETIIINFTAVLLAVVVVEIAGSYFSELTGVPADFTIWDQQWIKLVFPVLLIGGVFLTGFYPVLVISSFKPVEIVKGKFAASRSGLNLRKVLVVFQFVIALFLITGTIAVHNQISFMKEQDLGFSIDQTLVLKLPRVRDNDFSGKLETFKQVLQENSGIQNLCVATEVPGRQIYWDAGAIYRSGGDESESKNYQIVGIDYDFMELFDCEIIYGRNFSRDFPSDSASLLLNETAVEWLGFENSESVVGGKVVYWGETFTVVGVVKDYHQQSLKQEFEPHIFRFAPAGRGRLGVIAMKVNQATVQSTIGFVQNNFEDFFPGNPFDFFFLDEYYDQQYKSDELFNEVFGIFASLAIFITVLGIFGLSLFSASQRVKEIGIRKVLGSSVSQVVLLLIKDIFYLLAFSSILVIPILYYLVSVWLDDFANKMSIDVWLFILPVFIVGFVTLLTVGSQAFKASISNPVMALREE